MTPTAQARAERPAEPALFASLVDDAAVFPPGNAPLDEAVRLHGDLRSGPYAAVVGPLLVPAWAASSLAHLACDDGLRVAVIGRPGTPHAEVVDAVVDLGTAREVTVVGVEAGWTADWRDSGLAGLAVSGASGGPAGPAAAPLTLEVPRGPEQAGAIADIAADASDSIALQAKFRTGATETWPWPDERELATFIRTTIDHDLGFKLTGGLHHAVRGTHGHEEQHGLLNVLVAVRWALNGEDVDELVSLLAERDTATLVAQVERMSAADASIVRAFFSAFGCCGVLDPIRELAGLGLIEGA
jgi:hypothetical protein